MGGCAYGCDVPGEGVCGEGCAYGRGKVMSVRLSTSAESNTPPTHPQETQWSWSSSLCFTMPGSPIKRTPSRETYTPLMLCTSL